MQYKLKTWDGKEVGVLRSDGWFIPFDPSNTDYQKYLEWLAEGNEPLPAEDPPAPVKRTDATRK
jgi:hypothetical protein